MDSDSVSLLIQGKTILSPRIDRQEAHIMSNPYPYGALIFEVLVP